MKTISIPKKSLYQLSISIAIGFVILLCIETQGRIFMLERIDTIPTSTMAPQGEIFYGTKTVYTNRFAVLEFHTPLGKIVPITSWQYKITDLTIGELNGSWNRFEVFYLPATLSESYFAILLGMIIFGGVLLSKKFRFKIV